MFLLWLKLSWLKWLYCVFNFQCGLKYKHSHDSFKYNAAYEALTQTTFLSCLELQKKISLNKIVLNWCLLSIKYQLCSGLIRAGRETGVCQWELLKARLTCEPVNGEGNVECLMKTVNVWRNGSGKGRKLWILTILNKRMKSKSHSLPIMAPQDLFLPVFSTISPCFKHLLPSEN